MARKTLFDTQVGKASVLYESAAQAVAYLINNQDIYLKSEELSQIYKSGLRLSTAINQIFNHLYIDGKIVTEDTPNGIFAPIYIPKNTSVAEIISMSGDVTLDLKQVIQGSALKSLTQFYEKIIINLSPWLTILNSPTGKHYSVSDIHAVHSLYIRGALCASYQDSDGWLTMELGAFLAKTYGCILGGIIGNTYNLTLAEQVDIMAPITMYFCQAMSNSQDDLTHPILFKRCTFLGNQVKLAEYASQMKDITKDGLTINSMCDLVVRMGPGRLQSFNAALLYRTIAGLGQTVLQSRIAIEYPPYWVHLILLAVSNTKLGMAYGLKNERLVEEAKRFAFALNTCKAFLGVINR